MFQMPVNALLGTQGAEFRATCTGLLGFPDYILRTNNSTVAKMPVEMKTRHNLNLRDHDLWEIYRHADRVPIIQTLGLKRGSYHWCLAKWLAMTFITVFC